jgi:hypothetical protein
MALIIGALAQVTVRGLLAGRRQGAREDSS